MLELLTVVIIAVCGNWGWGDIPPPTATATEIETYILGTWDEIEEHGCLHCDDPDTTLEHVVHWIYCEDRPEKLDLEFVNMPISADEEWIREHTPYWNPNIEHLLEEEAEHHH